MPHIDRLGPALASLHALVDRVGPILGIVAFVGLAVIAFLVFQEAREIRRLREWAGRAPERSTEAAEAQAAAAEARDAAESGPPPGAWERFKGRIGGARDRVAGAFGHRWQELDRRSPVDPRIVLVVLVGVIVAAVVTSGFGLISSGGGSGGNAKAAKGPSHVKVAVLNGTQEAGVPAVAHLASDVEKQVVKPLGYKVGPVTNSPMPVSKTVVMFRAGHGADAKALATAVRPKLGTTKTKPMTSSIQSTAKPARLALVIGLDDSSFGQ
jgi:hypothetical protein